MARQRILVCGATGFIGRNLVEALARNANVELHALRFTRPVYDLSGVHWHQADLRDVEAVNRLLAGMDVVIQAAATTSGVRDIVNTPYIHVTDNAVMNSLLLRGCFDHKVKHFVFFSCSVMYQPRETPWREEEWDPNQEMHPNYFHTGWTKVYIEKMCEFFGRLGVTKHTVIRHTNVYGPHDKFDLERSHVFGATVTKVMTSKTRSLMPRDRSWTVTLCLHVVWRRLDIFLPLILRSRHPGSCTRWCRMSICKQHGNSRLCTRAMKMYVN